MATLQKIRNNAGLLVSIIIGLALLSFILGDLLTSGNTLFNKSQNNVAEIAGKSIPIEMYQGKIDENLENYKRQTGQSSLDQPTMDRLQDQTWEQLVRDFAMEDELAELGITICGDELFDMVQGNNIDPQIKQIPIFQNQETGQFDRTLVLQFLKNMEQDPTGKAQSSWNAFEKALAEEKINQKYNTLIEKGLFATTIQAKKEVVNKNLKSDFDYVTIKYNSVSDSSISFSEKDL
ncbi:MAG: SurA N-terminal domain-containing protein [Salinivirgaceae bacterium]